MNTFQAAGGGGVPVEYMANLFWKIHAAKELKKLNKKRAITERLLYLCLPPSLSPSLSLYLCPCSNPRHATPLNYLPDWVKRMQLSLVLGEEQAEDGTSVLVRCLIGTMHRPTLFTGKGKKSKPRESIQAILRGQKSSYNEATLPLGGVRPV